jgi:RNA polymerase sigma factor (TIGR02999 family)
LQDASAGPGDRAPREPSAELYRELRAVAAAQLRRERAGHTLQPTALVHEALLRLGGARECDRAQEIARAATAMRRILVEHARRGAARKRAGRRVTLSSGMLVERGPDLDLLALDDALSELARREPRAASVIELRFFGGLEVEDVARVLGVSKRSVESDWTFARTWLHRRLSA